MEMLVAKCHGEGGQEGSCSDLGTTLLGWIVLALRWLSPGNSGRNFALLEV